MGDVRGLRVSGRSGHRCNRRKRMARPGREINDVVAMDEAIQDLGLNG
jgi:hypothetical protein